MKLFFLITTILFVFCDLIFAQKELFIATRYYNEGVEMLENNKFSESDSLFTLSLELDRTVDAYYNRALVRKKLGDDEGFCNDMFMATAQGDWNARNIFLSYCSVIDTIYPDKNALENNGSSEIKLFAKRKYGSNTDIITIDSLGNKLWGYLNDTIPFSKEDSIAINKTEQMPSFPGGESALVQFLSKNIKYPPKALVKDIQGEVTCTYLIDREGNIKNIRETKGADPILDSEAVRVITGMPKWFPGFQNGKFVDVEYTLPIRFKLGM